MPLLWTNVVPLMFTCGQPLHLHISGSSARRQLCGGGWDETKSNYHRVMQAHAPRR